MDKKSQKHTEPEIGGVVVESLDAASARTGYTRDFLQFIKGKGCDAFEPGNRIRLDRIPTWLADHPEFTPENVALLSEVQVELRGHLIKQANDMQKLSERRKLFAKGEDVRRSVAKTFVATRLKLLAISATESQALALMTDPREIQQRLDSVLCDALGAVERGEWFDAEVVAKIEAALKS